MPEDRTTERSDDQGATWQTVTLPGRGEIAHALEDAGPGEVIDDGWGHLYRWRWTDG